MRLNYADMVFISHDVSNRDVEFQTVNDVIFDLESKFPLGVEIRKALFEARRAVNAAKFLNRVFEKTERLKALQPAT